MAIKRARAGTVLHWGVACVVVLGLLSLAVVWTAGLLSPGYTLDLGPEEWGRIQNANDWEDNGLFTYRWTRGTTRFRLPFLGTPRRLTLRIDGTRPAGVAPAEVVIRLDGREAARFVPPPGPFLYHLTYDGPSPWRWETVVEVQAETFRPEGDPRDLGVVVDRLHLSPPVARSGPAWLLVLLWAALGLAVVAWGRSLGWPWGGAGLLAVLVSCGLGGLLLWRREEVLPWVGLVLLMALGGAVVGRWGRRPAGQEVAPPGGAGPANRICGRNEWRSSRPLALFALLLALLVAAMPLLAGDWWTEHLFRLPRGGSWALYVLQPFYPQSGPLPRELLPWLSLLLVGLVVVPSFNRDLRRLVRRLWEAGRRLTPHLRPAARWWLLGLLFLPPGYLLRARVLWGDAPHLISRIGAGYRFAEPEMLTFFLHATLYRQTAQWWGWSVPDVYCLVSLICGAFYVGLAAALSSALGRSRLGRGVLFGLLVTLATVQFGFGYLENYALVTVLLLALFWQTVRLLRGEGSPAGVVVLWVLACAAHLQALLVGPAVLYALVQAWRKARLRWRVVGAALLGGLAPALLLAGLFLLAGYRVESLLVGNWVRGNNPVFFVPLRSETTYTLFSLRHLANLVNEHLLVAPVVLPLLAAVLLGYRRRVPWREPLLWMLVLAAAGLLLFASTLYPDLGPAKDWDLFAPAALPYTLLTGWLFDRAVPDGAGKGYTAALLLTAAGVHVALWVLLNAGVL